MADPDLRALPGKGARLSTDRHRTLTPTERREAGRRFNVPVIEDRCEAAVTAQPCPGTSTDDGPHPAACTGVMGYVSFAFRRRESGAMLALALGRCVACGAVGHVEVALDA